MQRKLVFERRYWAVDRVGERHEIFVYLDQTTGQLEDGSLFTLKGMRWHWLAANGKHVSVNDDGTLTVTESGTTLWSIAQE